MTAPNLKVLAPTPIPDVPESCGPQNEEEQRVYELVKAGLTSGEPIPVDAAYLTRLRARIASDKRN